MGSTGSLLGHYAKELRRHREKAGKSQSEVAKEAGYENGQISKVERTERVPQPRLDQALDRMFGLDGQFVALGEEIRVTASLTKEFGDYVTREPQATAIYTYESLMIPGLLQTPEYARAVIESSRPSHAPSAVDSLLAFRMTRQDILSRTDPPQLWAVLGEGVLHCQLGSAEVMTEQLDRLLEASRQPHVTIQVYPFSMGVGPSVGQSFLLADFADQPGAFYIDGPPGVATVGDDQTLGRFRVVFDHLRAGALPEQWSAEVIRKRVEELRRP